MHMVLLIDAVFGRKMHVPPPLLGSTVIVRVVCSPRVSETRLIRRIGHVLTGPSPLSFVSLTSHLTESCTNQEDCDPFT